MYETAVKLYIYQFWNYTQFQRKITSNESSQKAQVFGTLQPLNVNYFFKCHSCWQCSRLKTTQLWIFLGKETISVEYFKIKQPRLKKFRMWIQFKNIFNPWNFCKITFMYFLRELWFCEQQHIPKFTSIYSFPLNVYYILVHFVILSKICSIIYYSQISHLVTCSYTWKTF